jgi:serine/threonine protein kinase
MIMVKRENLADYGYSIDWWSLGTFCFELYVGHPPFQDKNVKIMTERILTERVRFPPSVQLPSLPFRDFVFALLNRDPSKRLGTEVKVRDHMFFEGLNWQDQVYMKRMVPPVVPKVDPLEVTLNFDPQSDDEDGVAQVTKMSVLPSSATPSTTATMDAQPTTATKKMTKFVRFIPLSSLQPPTAAHLPTVDAPPPPSATTNKSQSHLPDEEKALTSMFKSFAFVSPNNKQQQEEEEDVLVGVPDVVEIVGEEELLRLRNLHVEDGEKEEALWAE